jgi:N-acetylneuraminate synthase
MDGIRFVAEFTTNHLGNFNLLMKMVSNTAKAGCSLIKMQKKDVYSFYTPEKLNTPYESPYGKTYAEYREIFEFDEHDFSRFDKACRAQSIPWFATVQDMPSLDFLLKFDLDIYKIASVNVRNTELISAVLANVPKSKEIVISVGGAAVEEIERILNRLAPFKKVTILHCVSEYPCNVGNLRLGNIPELIRLFSSSNIEIGYSGHEEGYIPSLVAVGLGAKMIERHFCVSRATFAHHIDCSLEPDEYSELIQTIKNAASPDDLLAYKDRLPAEAMNSFFGMSRIESDFLLAGQYGTKYIKGKSEIHVES